MAAMEPRTLKTLRKMYSVEPDVRRFFDHILRTGPGRRTVMVLDDLLGEMAQFGNDAPRSATIALFKNLEELRVGEWVVGRRGHPSRFEWHFRPHLVARALIEAPHAAPHRLSAAEREQMADPVETIQLEFPLRRGHMFKLEVPRDLTQSEADRLARWITALPYAG